MYHRVATLKLTDVSEVHTASIIRTMNKTSVNFNVTIQHYIPQESKLNIRCCENLNSHTTPVILVGCGKNWNSEEMCTKQRVGLALNFTSNTY
jgi:hypothetical protein